MWAPGPVRGIHEWGTFGIQCRQVFIDVMHVRRKSIFFRDFVDRRNVENLNDFVEGDDLVLVGQLIDGDELVPVRDVSLKFG